MHQASGAITKEQIAMKTCLVTIGCLRCTGLFRSSAMAVLDAMYRYPDARAISVRVMP